ncbi:MAG: BamA/TamA family outer membrane protein [Deltaproteobacteria bacterium]|nr:BamA/TamA family outer membrane protein [Deltaproteobacteria bacterium]MCB9787523.1 BamA/TamA family outer membrane protein [Deltaproteobacteria bacterium]
MCCFTGAGAGAAPPDEAPGDGATQAEVYAEAAAEDAHEGQSLPGEARGVRVPARHRARWLLWVPRTIFFIPRMVIDVATLPVLGAAWVASRYQLRERFTEVFFNDERTFGVFPTAFIETGFGLNVGARLVHKDLFGRQEHLSVRAGFGGRYEQRYEGSLDSGERFTSRVRVRLSGGWERLGSTRFNGLGNRDTVAPETAGAPVDLRRSDSAVRSSYRERRGWVRLDTRVDLRPRTELRWSHAWSFRRLEADPDGEGAPLPDAYALGSLVGFGDVVRENYNELALTFDGRRSMRSDWPPILASSGVWLETWVGYATGVRATPSDHARAGFDVQPFINLWRGDRVLRLRLRVDSVIGAYDHIPFDDYPTLGGPVFLRGYTRDRFRGRLTALATAEYRYPIQHNLAGYVFVDAGRAWRRFEDLSPRGLRLGFGFGIDVVTSRAFILSLQLASSIDGGVHFSLNLDPQSVRRATF